MPAGPRMDPNGRGGRTQLQSPGGGHHAAKSLTFCQSLGKRQTFAKTPTLSPGACSRRSAQVARGPRQLCVGPCQMHHSLSSSVSRLVSTQDVPGADGLTAHPPGLADS